jgi:hypothetical protein
MKGDKKHYLEVAERRYEVMKELAMKIPVFQLAFRKLRRGGSESPDKNFRMSNLESWWRQIFSLYYGLSRSLQRGLSYYEVADSFSKEEPKMYGMIQNFQFYFEDFLFRLFSLMDKVGQISNVYHNLGYDIEDVTLLKVIKKWEDPSIGIKPKPPIKPCSIDDSFTQSVQKHYCNSKTMTRLREIRHHMIHKLGIAFIGIGYPFIHRKKTSGSVVYTYGGYEMKLEPKEMKNLVLDAFNEVTEMLKELDEILDSEWKV